MRMTDERLDEVYNSPWTPENRSCHRQGLRAVESEARRRAFDEIIAESRGLTVVETFAMIERKAKESR